MKKRLFGGVAASMVSAGLLAAPAVANAQPETYDWSGFYIGVEAGASWTTDKITETASPFAPPSTFTGHANLHPLSWNVGGLGGYNWQFGSWVVGLEGDGGYSGVRKSSTCFLQDAGAGNLAPGSCFPPGYAYSIKTPWQGSVRARVGYAFGPALVYATGGYALSTLDATYTTFPVAGAPGSQTFHDYLNGWTAGGGLEYAVSRNWRIGVEYRYSAYKHTDIPFAAGDFWNGFSDQHKLDDNAVRFRLIYAFAAPPPPPPPPPPRRRRRLRRLRLRLRRPHRRRRPSSSSSTSRSISTC